MELFSNQSFTHLLELFFWLLGAFLIGFFFGKISNPKKETSLVDFEDSEELDLDLEQDTSQIRATKTFERGGKQMAQSYFDEEVECYEIEDGLEFKRIGKGSNENKNDLKLLKGIGKGIEEKLNNIGIFNFNQISKLTSNDIKIIASLIKFSQQRIKSDDWVGQAKKLLK